MNSTALKIEKRVPAPRGRSKYPFAQLKVGESFEVPTSIASIGAVRVAAGYFCRKNPGVLLVTRQNAKKDGCRVWRVVVEE